MNALILRNHEGLAVEVTETATAMKERLLKEAGEIQNVSDDFTCEVAVDAVRDMKNALAVVEESRKAIKAPILDIGRRIDTTAQHYSRELAFEASRVNKLVSDFHAAQKRKQEEAERLRQAELKRIDDARKAAEDKARRESEEEMKASRTIAQATVIQETTQAKLATIADTALALQQTAAAIAAPAPVRIEGTITKQVWRFEVIDLNALIDEDVANEKRHGLVRYEPNAANINAAIRGGMRECAGVRIWSEVVTEVRR